MNKIFICLTGLALVLLCGCTTTIPLQQADYLSEKFNKTDVDRIYLYPLIDCRVGNDKNKRKLNHDDGFYYVTLNMLGQWDYRVVVTGDRAVVTELAQMPTVDGIMSALTGLKIDPNKRWNLFCALLDSYRKVGFGSVGNAELMAFLYDNKTKEVVWRKKAEGQSGESMLSGGVGSLFTSSAHERRAVHDATVSILASFPHDPTKEITPPRYKQ